MCPVSVTLFTVKVVVPLAAEESLALLTVSCPLRSVVPVKVPVVMPDRVAFTVALGMGLPVPSVTVTVPWMLPVDVLILIHWRTIEDTLTILPTVGTLTTLGRVAEEVPPELSVTVSLAL